MNAYEQMREAITKAEAVIDGTRMMVLQGQEYDLGLLDFDGALKMLRAALALPRRNCDVFADALWDTISRAWQEWLLTPEFNKRKIGGMKEFCYWILGPAKKGAAK